MRVQYSLTTAITGQVFGSLEIFSQSIWQATRRKWPFPIVLSSFNGTLTSQGRVLDWTTAQETGGSHFELQRSTDGQTFTPVVTIAAGGSDLGAQYSYTDQQALPGVSMVYYRLKTVNIDGSYNYSLVIVIKLNSNNGPQLRLLNSLVSGNAVVQYSSPTAGTLQLRVISASGQLMLQQNLAVAPGVNSFTISTQQLPKGWYILQGGETSVRFVKQ